MFPHNWTCWIDSLTTALTTSTSGKTTVLQRRRDSTVSYGLRWITSSGHITANSGLKTIDVQYFFQLFSNAKLSSSKDHLTLASSFTLLLVVEFSIFQYLQRPEDRDRDRNRDEDDSPKWFENSGYWTPVPEKRTFRVPCRIEWGWFRLFFRPTTTPDFEYREKWIDRKRWKKCVRESSSGVVEAGAVDWIRATFSFFSSFSYVETYEYCHR